MSVGAITALTLAATERPLVIRLSRIGEIRGWGIVPRLPLPRVVRTVVAIILTDYTLYWWHVLMHRVPWLWRCHAPHHINRDLDTTTALRFHFAEFLASIPWRCAQVMIIGGGPRALSLWQKLTALEVLFHHSNVRLPVALEQGINRILVRPRMHGIHHSVVSRERARTFRAD